MNLSKKPLAMAYVPWQEFENVLDAGCGLGQGTIFEDLIFPFIGAEAACRSVQKQPSSNSNRQQRRNCGCEQTNTSYGRRRGY